METLFSQMQQFGQGAAQIWQDQLTLWERATEAAFAAQRDLYARWRVVQDGVTSANTSTPPRT